MRIGRPRRRRVGPRRIRRWPRVLRGVLVVLALAAVASGSSRVSAHGPTSSATPPVVGQFQVVYTFGSATAITDYYDMAALSQDDVWATGASCTTACASPGSGGPESMLTEHWDGYTWQSIPPPAGLAVQTAGESVSALSASDAWVAAVGADRAGHYQPYALHWSDGQWTTYRFATGVWLNQVLAFSDSDVWVFGATYSARPGVGSVSVNYHFNGRTWQEFSLPILVSTAAAAGPDDIWSVGQPPASRPAAVDTAALAVHWNGSDWQSAALPAVRPPAGSTAASGDTTVDGVTVTGPGDVWAAYVSATQAGCCDLDGLLHLVGQKWQRIPVPASYGTVYSPTLTMSQDGEGGVWLSLPGEIQGQPGWLAHYGAGLWSRATVGALSGTPVLLNGPLTWIPGTSDVWVMGWMTPLKSTGSTSQAAVLELPGVYEGPQKLPTAG